MVRVRRGVLKVEIRQLVARTVHCRKTGRIGGREVYDRKKLFLSRTHHRLHNLLAGQGILENDRHAELSVRS